MELDRARLKKELKQLIISECDKEDEFTVDDIADDAPFMGSDGVLGLDSLDALQISLAVKKAYNVRIEGAVDGRKALASINALADYILTERGSC